VGKWWVWRERSEGMVMLRTGRELVGKDGRQVGKMNRRVVGGNHGQGKLSGKLEGRVV
jgi:hypothetical protein